MLVRPNNRAVDKDFFKISVFTQFGKDALPNPCIRPASKPFVSAIPHTQFLGQVAPRRTRPGNPQHRFHKQPIVCSGLTSVALFARQHLFNPLPLVITQ
jgi:hypothetical protein